MVLASLFAGRYNVGQGRGKRARFERIREGMDVLELGGVSRELFPERLTEALEEELQIYFQPQYDHSTGLLRGAEALVRWQLPGRGLILPGSFIPALEDSGRITELDLYVFAQVCRFQRRNLEEGRAMVPVSVNLSRRDLLTPGFPERLEEIRQSCGLPVCWLCLEITESAFVKETEQLCTAVERLRKLGYTVRMDDFGSGYSGLNLLKDIEVDAIKLDMRFLGGETGSGKSGIIIASVVRMIQWLELDVVAEGVETAQQADFLRSIGCDFMQGYLFSPPVPEAEYLTMLDAAVSCGWSAAGSMPLPRQHSDFWNPDSLDSLVFNSFIGPAAIFAYEKGRMELMRVNPFYLRELGGELREGELIGTDPLDRLDDEARRTYRGALERAIRDCKDQVFEIWRTVSGPEGEQRLFVRAAVRLIGRSGDRFLFCGLIRNITEETDLTRLMLTAMDKLVERVGDHVFVKDRNFVYCAASPVFAEMTGYPVEDIIGKTDFDIFPHELAQRYREDDVALLAAGEDLLNFVEPMNREDGKPRYGSTSKYILRDERGSPMGLMGVSRDVTMEYHVRSSQRQELAYLFYLPDDVYFAVYIDLQDWRIIAENRQQVGEYSFPAHGSAEALGKAAFSRIADYRWPAYGFYRDFSARSLREVYESGRREITMEYRRKMPDQSLRWVRDELKLFRDHSNDHPCMMLIVRDIQQRKEEEQARILMAEHDELTGVLARSATMRLLRELLESRQDEVSHALFMIDSDHFKTVNDTYGHQEGDRILAQIARTIQNCFRDSDLVGRIGGDEFFALMKHIPNRKVVEEKAELLRQRLNGIYAGAGQLRLSGSIGIAFFERDGDTLESLYKAADAAMYRAKQLGRNRAVFFEDL